MLFGLLDLQNPGSGMGKNAGPVFGTFINNFFAIKYLSDTDPGSCAFLTLNPGSEMEKFRFGIKHPGSATLLLVSVLRLWLNNFNEILGSQCPLSSSSL